MSRRKQKDAPAPTSSSAPESATRVRVAAPVQLAKVIPFPTRRRITTYDWVRIAVAIQYARSTVETIANETRDNEAAEANAILEDVIAVAMRLSYGQR